MSRIVKSTESDVAHIMFNRLLLEKRLPLPIPEYSFDALRKWRFDYAWPERKVALEVDGGIWTKGRHTRGKGWQKDTEKLNTAATQGWRCLRCTPQQLATLEMMDTIKAVLKYRDGFEDVA